MATAPRHPTPARAFTLVECAVCVVIVGVMLVAAFNVSAAAIRSRRLQWELRARETLARALMNEVRQAAYHDSGSPGTVGVRLNLLGLVRLQIGGTTQSGAAGRLGFDSLDDYDGYTEASPTLRDGTAIEGFTGWRRAVRVEKVDPEFPGAGAIGSDKGLKRIIVGVASPSGKTTQCITFRSAWSLFQADPGASVTGIDLRLSTESDRSVWLSSALPNQPSQ